MSEVTRVAIDAMGGDNAPGAIVRGALQGLTNNSNTKALLVGQEEAIKKELDGQSANLSRVEIINASQVIETGEHPAEAIRRKKDSSMVVGLQLVKKGEADGLISAGNSGALLVGGQAFLRDRRFPRAPFAPIIPTTRGQSILLDAGANIDVRAEHLLQFAQMGTIYMRDVLGIEKPSVGLLNIGTEEYKGNALTREAYPMLSECEDIYFTGNLEAREIPFGGADVIVCDGFAGNIALKLIEGVASALMGGIKEGMYSNTRSKIGGLLVKPALKKTLSTYDTSKHGGAPMLGLKGLVVKVHGNAKEAEIANSMKQCQVFTEQHVAQKILEGL